MKMTDEKREWAIELCIDSAQEVEDKELKKSILETASFLINGRSQEQIDKMEIKLFGKAVGNQ